MDRISDFFWGLLSISCSTDSTPAEELPYFKFSEDNGGLTLPDGFRAVVVTDSIGYARHITVRDNGDIYVALYNLYNGHGIAALRDTKWYLFLLMELIHWIEPIKPLQTVLPGKPF